MTKSILAFGYIVPVIEDHRSDFGNILCATQFQISQFQMVCNIKGELHHFKVVKLLRY